MKLLKTIVSTKRFDIENSATIKEAMSVMHQNKNGCVVLLENKKPVSIITESDIVAWLKSSNDLNDKALNLAKKTVVTASQNRPIEFAFDILSKHNIRRVVLVNDDNNYVGVVLQEELFDYLEEDVYKVELKISDILKADQPLFTINHTQPTEYALKIMQSYGIGSVVVTKDEDEIVGIITEKDILNLTFNEEDLTKEISNHMTSPVITVNQSYYITEVIDIMKLNNIRRIVVVDNKNSFIGLLTNRDVLKHIRGNYTKILQNRIKHAQEMMDFVPEPILEIYYFSNDDIIYGMNHQAKKIFGEENLDKSITNIIPKDEWAKIRKLIVEVKYLKDVSLKLGEFTYEISGTLSRNINTNYIKLLFKDVTNYEKEKNKLQNLVEEEIKKRLDSEYLLMQQSKLATMGEMIGHIAHQWRQPLAQLGGIFMNLESAYEFDELTHDYLEQKVNHGNDIIKYMSKTIEDFRYFFEPNKQKEYFSIATYIENAINIIRAALTYNYITLNLEQLDTTTHVVGYPSEFSQVILNILANARDVIIEKKVKDPYIKIKSQADDKMIRITIEDNGGGVDEAVIDKIFDIYFTTKPKKVGSGLGLYMSKLIIENKFKGQIYVQNSNNGALFTIELPKN